MYYTTLLIQIMNISFFLSHNYVNTFVHFCLQLPVFLFSGPHLYRYGTETAICKKIHFTASFIQLKDTSKMDFFEIYFY